MATLNFENILNGNTIEPNDLLQLYKAFGTGSGDNITGLIMTGSLNGNASTATTASYTLSSSFAVSSSHAISSSVATTSSYALSSSVAVSSSFTISSSVAVSSSRAISSSFATTASYALSSSFATTASYAANTGVSNTTTLYRAGISTQASKPFAGTGSFSSGIANINLSTQFPDLSYSTLGVDLFVTAMAASNTEYIGVSFSGSTLTFRSSNVSSTGAFYYIGWAK